MLRDRFRKVGIKNLVGGKNFLEGEVDNVPLNVRKKRSKISKVMELTFKEYRENSMALELHCSVSLIN